MGFSNGITAPETRAGKQCDTCGTEYGQRPNIAYRHSIHYADCQHEGCSVEFCISCQHNAQDLSCEADGCDKIHLCSKHAIGIKVDPSQTEFFCVRHARERLEKIMAQEYARVFSQPVDGSEPEIERLRRGAA